MCAAAILCAACGADDVAPATAESSVGSSAGTSSDASEDASSEGGVTTAADTGAPPGPWDSGWPVPAEPQTPGDPESGWYQLTHEGYIQCGIPHSMWGIARPFIDSYVGAEPLPGRLGDNETMPYDWTVHTAPSGVKLVSQNCLTCHAGYFNGELVLGLGNAHADFTSSLGELAAAIPTPNLPSGEIGELVRFVDRIKALGPETAMRTVGTNPAEMIAVSLVAHRDPITLEWSDEPLQEIPGLRVPSDPPPWWRAHKKNGLFYNAMARGDHRGTMLLATSMCTDTVAEANAIASYFNNIHSYIRSLRAPPYPFEIDASLAAQGEAVFAENCAPCHGTYAADEDDETYPNLLFPLDVIGTDPIVALGGVVHAPYLVDWYNTSYYGQITRMEPNNPFPGYMAPPLDGVWATGPFLHNGSVPTIELVLDSTRRPTYWKRIDFDSASFDEEAVGWPYVSLNYGHDSAAAADAKYIYDTTQVAHDSAGHIFGDHLTDEQRRAVLEYVKTL